MSLIWNFVIFWGVWLLVPLIIDGIGTIGSLFSILLAYLHRKPFKEFKYYPLVSIIIPVYNSASTLESCVNSLKGQDYPKGRMEILLVDNGSTDDSHAVFKRLHASLGLNINWIAVMNQGKSWALNAGIYIARGDYIINVDSDIILAPNAISNLVHSMEEQPKMGAMTAAIHVLPPDEHADRLTQLLGRCEFLEYMTAYHVGRMQQTMLRNLYTLSGAFSAFRKEVIFQTDLYNQKTVTEDTDMTFHLYERHGEWLIGCETRVVAYTEPIRSLQALYAQRVRWQRGQVEVSARYSNSLMKRPVWKLFGFSPSRVLLIDHTLSFIRMVWTLFMPILMFFEYSLSFIVLALVIIYIFYLFIDIIWMVVSWLDADEYASKRMEREVPIVLLMPAYRMLVFYFRMSGFLHAVAEPGSWRVEDPMAQTRSGFARLIDGAGSQLKSFFKRR